MHTILCINASDCMGHTGIQADIRTVKDMGCQTVSAVTSVTIQNSAGITSVYDLPPEVISGQVAAIYDEMHPDAVKVGLINSAETIRRVRKEIVGCRHIVCSPVIVSSFGGLLMGDDAIHAYASLLFPICSLLIMKCIDAEIVLGRRICTDDDMLTAADALHDMGAEWVLLRGGTYNEGRINALLSGPGCRKFFSSVNISGWQRHGVGGALSTAVASRLALGDDTLQAVTEAHDYMHSQVVYASTRQHSLQPSVLYDRFMSLLAGHYTSAHDVAFYASELSISTRYLSQITKTVCGRSPKQIIDSYLIKESEQLLAGTTLTIQQVADRLGFASQIAYAKFFKAKRGYAPSVFRSLKSND